MKNMNTKFRVGQTVLINRDSGEGLFYEKGVVEAIPFDAPVPWPYYVRLENPELDPGLSEGPYAGLVPCAAHELVAITF